MKRSLITLFPLAMLLTTLAAPAAANPVTWTITNVSLSDGGSLQGWFTYDSSQLYPVTDWSFTAELGSGHSYPPDPIQNPYTFMPANSTLAMITTPHTPIAIEFITPFSYNTPGVQVQYVLQLATTAAYGDVPDPFIQSVPIPLMTGAGALSVTDYDVLPPNSARIKWQAFNSIETADLTTTVPEPCILLLLGPLLAGLLGCGWKYKCI